MILVGSRALMFRAPFILNRKPKDFDFIGYENEIYDWLKKNNIINSYREDNKIIVKDPNFICEFEIVEKGDAAELLLNLVKNDPYTIKTEFGLVPNLNLLFTLKSSHKYLKNSPHFWKTFTDYHKMKLAGAKILPEYMEFFKKREKETYNYSHPKLNVTKENFFKDDGIRYKFIHDDLHLAVRHLEKPAYEYYKKDGAEVATDKTKFFAVEEKIRLYGVLEEAFVLALERSQITFPGKLTPKQSFMLAFSKVCSSITSGYFREYAYNNGLEVLALYSDSYIDKFQKGVETGLVRKVKVTK